MGPNSFIFSSDYKKIGVFISSVILIVVLVDLTLSAILDSLYQQTYTGQTGGKLNFVLDQESKFDMLVLGNSRANHQVNPDLMSFNAFNLGVDGRKITYQNAVISILKMRSKLPPRVILHLDIDNFTCESPKDTIPTDVIHLSYYYGKNELVSEYLNSTSKLANIKYVFKLYRYNGTIFNLMENYFESMNIVWENYSGYEPIPADARDSLKIVYQLRESAKDQINLKLCPKLLQELGAFIATCKQENVDLVCFTSPAYNGDLNLQYYQRSELAKYLAKKNVEYLDYTVSSDLDNIQFWSDVKHLNSKGAEVFTRNLNTDLQKTF